MSVCNSDIPKLKTNEVIEKHCSKDPERKFTINWNEREMGLSSTLKEYKLQKAELVK